MVCYVARDKMYTYTSIRVCRRNIKHSFSDIKLQYGPQLNLWNGLKSKLIRSKNYNIAHIQIHLLIPYIVYVTE